MGTRNIKRDSWQAQVAHELWVITQATVEVTCDAVRISPTTLKRWRDWFGWDEERKRQAQGYGPLLSATKKQIDALGRKIEDAPADDLERLAEIGKLLGQMLGHVERIRKIERDVDFKRLALRWTRELGAYLEQQDLKALAALQPHLKRFLHEVIRG